MFELRSNPHCRSSCTELGQGWQRKQHASVCCCHVPPDRTLHQVPSGPAKTEPANLGNEDLGPASVDLAEGACLRSFGEPRGRVAGLGRLAEPLSWVCACLAATTTAARRRNSNEPGVRTVSKKQRLLGSARVGAVAAHGDFCSSTYRRIVACDTLPMVDTKDDLAHKLCSREPDQGNTLPSTRDACPCSWWATAAAESFGYVRTKTSTWSGMTSEASGVQPLDSDSGTRRFLPPPDVLGQFL